METSALQGPPRGETASGVPLIALVGRPNVGKSTLFNRLLGRREAIVEGEPGTTRDRIYGEAAHDDALFGLVDMAGLVSGPQADLARHAQEQAQLAIAEADAILFLVDAQTGVTPVDEDIAGLLRRSGKPVFLVANKAETRARELAATEFYTLGLDEPIPVSAYHGEGVGQLMDRVLARCPSPARPIPVLAGIKVAVAGRPNVGKSMLINAILGQERVLVDAAPGTTRDAVDTPFVHGDTAMVLIDTAGIRRSGRVLPGVERYSTLRSLRAISRADVAVMVLDAEDGVTAQDTHIAGYVRDAHKGIVLAVNKWDLAPLHQLQRQAFLDQLTSRLKFFPHAPVVFLSAKLGHGIDRLLAAVVKVQQAREIRVPTAAFNEWMHQALSTHPPPIAHGRQLRVLYGTQASVAPPTFVFFVNDPSLVHFSYQRYLENRLRESFGFQGTALQLVFKSRSEG